MENKDLLKKSIVVTCVGGSLLSSLHCSGNESHYCTQTKPYQHELAEKYVSNSSYQPLPVSATMNATASTVSPSPSFEDFDFS
jgi:hypothetical protein